MVANATSATTNAATTATRIEAPMEKRLQGNTRQSTTIVKAKDGSSQALQFDRKRVRLVHIDNDGTTTPEGEWKPLNLPRILRWIEHTTPSARGIYGFQKLTDGLSQPEPAAR